MKITIEHVDEKKDRVNLTVDGKHVGRIAGHYEATQLADKIFEGRIVLPEEVEDEHVED